jgi:predicted alpha/beta-fold hydrolase
MPINSTTPQTYTSPVWLRDGLAMTLHGAWWSGARWLKQAREHHHYRPVTVPGADGIPLHGWLTPPVENQRGTIIATYGITGEIENQWYLRLFAQHARDRGYAVLLLDWRAHGKSVEHSPVFTSDGIHEGRDFLCAAHWLKTQNYPAPFFFSGYSLGGQLALWGAKYGSDFARTIAPNSLETVGSTYPHSDDHPQLHPDDLGGATTLAPSLHSTRSLRYLANHEIGRRIDRSITRNIHHLVRNIHHHNPGTIDLSKLDRVHTIWDYDREYAINPLGFATVEDYFDASSPLSFLPNITLPTQIIYAANDPMFDPSLVGDLRRACADNPAIELTITQHGGHIAHRSDRACQHCYGDPDPWWAMHRSLDWIDRQTAAWKGVRDSRLDAIVA